MPAHSSGVDLDPYFRPPIVTDGVRDRTPAQWTDASRPGRTLGASCAAPLDARFGDLPSRTDSDHADIAVSGATSDCDVPDDEQSLGAARAMHTARRRRRMGDIRWGDLAYRVYTTALAVLVLTIFASGLVGDEKLGPSEVASVRELGPVWAGLLLCATLFLGIRSGVRSGPLAMEATDVHHLLLAPLDRSRILRVPAISMLGYGAAAGAAVGGLCGELLSQRLPGTSASWIVPGALFGAVVVALSLGAAMFTASRKIPRPVPELVGAALIAWSVADLFDVAPIAPATMAGRMVFWPLHTGPAPWAAVVVTLAVAAAGVHWVGGLSVEGARRRTSLVGQLRFAVTQQDLRSVLLLRRQLAAERPRNRPLIRRVPQVVGRRFPVMTRDLQSLLRWPTVRILRVLILVIGAALALRGTYSGTTPLILLAGVLSFVAALDATEPLAQEVDHPTMLASYPRPAGLVLVHHLTAPVLTMLMAGTVAMGVSYALDPHHALIAALTVLSGSLAAVAGAAVSVVSEVELDHGDAAMFSPEVAGPRVVFRTLWPPAVATIGVLPVLFAQRAHRVGQDPVGPALTIAVISMMLSVAVFGWVRFRADIHEAAGMSTRGASS